MMRPCAVSAPDDRLETGVRSSSRTGSADTRLSSRHLVFLQPVCGVTTVGGILCESEREREAAAFGSG